MYSLSLMELETLKTYIKNNLANAFIKSSKLIIEAFILFDKKPNKNLRLCVDYQALNNQTMQNRYSLSLVSKPLD